MGCAAKYINVYRRQYQKVEATGICEVGMTLALLSLTFRRLASTIVDVPHR